MLLHFITFYLRVEKNRHVTERMAPRWQFTSSALTLHLVQWFLASYLNLHLLKVTICGRLVIFVIPFIGVSGSASSLCSIFLTPDKKWTIIPYKRKK